VDTYASHMLDYTSVEILYHM